MVKKFDNMFTRFDRIHPERQTDTARRHRPR